MFLGAFHCYDTTFSGKTVYLKESGKTGSKNQLNTPVRNVYFWIIKGKKLDPPVKDLVYTEIYRMLYSKVQVIMEVTAREKTY
jgi:hypothetical protein